MLLGAQQHERQGQLKASDLTVVAAGNVGLLGVESFSPGKR